MPPIPLELRDIHTADNISWQLAWGWWVLMMIVIIGLAFLVFYFIKRYQKNKLKTTIKKQLKSAVNKKNPPIECLLILRSYATLCYPNEGIAAFNEQQWRDFLIQEHPPNDALRLLFSQTMYQKTPDFEIQQLLNYCQKWVDHV